MIRCILITLMFVFPKVLVANETKSEFALIEIKTISNALELFRLESFTYPNSREGLQALIDAKYIEKQPIDPWGNEYKYANPGLHGEIDIYSFGPDEIESEDDIGNWMLDE